MEKSTKTLKTILIILGYALLLAVIVLLLAGSRRSSAAEETSAVAEVPSEESVSESTPETEETTTEEPETTTVADTVAPVIEGVEDLTVHAGTSVSYKANITVTDDKDPEPSLSVDASKVNTDTVGSYYVIYIAEDASGNQSYEVANVHVVPLDVITSDEANALADEILAEILWDPENMTDLEKIEEVFFYLHAIGYTERNYGDIHSYLDNAYYFLTTRLGDCRCFYSASKLLLERLGYQCMMVKSSEASTRLHYWNLVSTDGGETWYHFDPTDWEWDDNGEFICMVSDAWLNNYADEHGYPALHWDPEFYPATPEYSFS